jgi:predicted transcriptional regulator
MTAKLSKELSDALHSLGDDRLEVVDPLNNRVYYLVEATTLAQLEQSSTHNAIAQGIADMEAGRGKPAAEADADLREKLGFPPRDA